MAKWAEKTGMVLLVLGLLLYVAAKLDFIVRYEPGNLSAYLGRHWIFWAGMAVIGMLMLIVAGVGALWERIGRGQTTGNKASGDDSHHNEE